MLSYRNYIIVKFYEQFPGNSGEFSIKVYMKHKLYGNIQLN